MLTERRRSLLVFNGIGLIASAVLSGWLYFFFTLGAIDLWPFVTDVPVSIPGDRRAWNMAHLEGITNGTMLIAIGAGHQRPEWMTEVLQARSRDAAAPTFSPDGLYFLGPVYDAALGLPERTPAFDWLP